ncbi:MAG TPA: FkbM family methyltransferase [Rickettsiales bacterium]|nr:FkbM family methyltransferase [Rickettsiales bacterium]
MVLNVAYPGTGEISKQQREVARDVISAAGTCYVIGKNGASEALIARGGIAGVIDDNAAPGTLWNGVPAVKSSELGKDAMVVNCSFSISPVSVHRMLEKRGVRHIPYYVLPEVDPNIALPDFVQEFRSDFKAHRKEWDALYTLLGDEESRRILTDIVNFRLSGDYRFMMEYSVRFKDQYFDPIVKTGPEEVFVDCGGFDGDTILEFIKRYGQYKKIVMFEPSAENFNRAQANLAQHENIELVMAGVSDVLGTLSFSGQEGSASHIDAQGATAIMVETLDHHIRESITFIKMDIEGWEQNALRGAEVHIKQDHPKLAVAVYHSAQDFWQIPKLVRGMRNDYRIYLRHYSEGWSETVMYFIPA